MYSARNAHDSGPPPVKNHALSTLNKTNESWHNFLVGKTIKIFVLQDNLLAKEMRRKRWKTFGEAAGMVVSRSVANNASRTMTVAPPSRTLDLRPSRARLIGLPDGELV